MSAAALCFALSVSFRYSENAIHATEAEARELQQQQWNAGCSDDNSKLQGWVIELENENRGLRAELDRLAQACLKGANT